jgi:hypothetical protein
MLAERPRELDPLVLLALTPAGAAWHRRSALGRIFTGGALFHAARYFQWLFLGQSPEPESLR